MTIMPPQDRRQRRSVDPLIALHYQLAQARTRGALEAIVVADASGVVVAGAGSWAACEELAAYAPLLARPHTSAYAMASGSLHESAPPPANAAVSRVDALRTETAVTSFEVHDQELLVCARGGVPEGETRAIALAAVAFGVARILRAAA